MSNFLLEYLHRARAWRYLTGGDGFDYDGCLKRLSIAFDADRADPRYRIPVVEAMPGLAAPPQRVAPRLVG